MSDNAKQEGSKLSNIEHWEPPTDREWTEAERWRWTAEHHREFRVRAEDERADLRQQLKGAVEVVERIRAELAPANPHPEDYSPQAVAIREALKLIDAFGGQ